MPKILGEQDLAAIIVRIQKVLKDTKKDAIPIYTPVYPMLVELTNTVAVHSEYGVFPDKLFKEKAPNEDPDEFKYRKSIYKQRTLSFWNRALSTINRIWNPQNYSIELADDNSLYSDNTSMDFFYKNFPDQKNIITYFRSVVSPHKIKDPNACLLIMPEDLPVINGVDETGKPIVTFDQTAIINPGACIYPMPHVIEYDEDDHIILLSYETSPVQVGDKTVQQGLIYYIVDSANYWKITQVGKKGDNYFVASVYYQHNLGYLPAQLLKGKPGKKDDFDFYFSYFMDAIPYLDIATCNGSTLDMSTYAHAFPERWEFVEDCPGENGFPCIGGKIANGDEKNTTHQCSTCSGRGVLYKHSPLGVFELKGAEKFNEQDNGIPTPPFGYVAPDSGILEFLEKRIKNDIVDAFTFVNIDVSNTDVAGQANANGDTALGAKIDREELFSFLMTISNELFDLLTFTIKACGQIRYGDKFKEPVIKAPTDFSIRSESDLTDEIAVAKTSGLPSIALRKLIRSYIDTRFNTSQDINQVVDVIMACDRLVIMDDLTINANISVGRVAKWEAILHDSIASFIEEKQAENPKYLEVTKLPVIKADLIAQAKLLEAQITPAQNSAASILGKAGSTPSDPNAPPSNIIALIRQLNADGKLDSILQ